MARRLLVIAALVVGLLVAVYSGAVGLPAPLAGLFTVDGQIGVELLCIYVPEVEGGAGTFKVDVIDVSPKEALLSPDDLSARIEIAFSISYYGPGVGVLNLSRGEFLCDSPRPVTVGFTVIDGSGESRLFNREVELGWTRLLVWLHPGSEKVYQVEFKGTGGFGNVRIGDAIISSQEIIFSVSEVGTG